MQVELVQNFRSTLVQGQALQYLAGFLANHLHDRKMQRDDIMRVQLVVILVKNLVSCKGTNQQELLIHVRKCRCTLLAVLY